MSTKETNKADEIKSKTVKDEKTKFWEFLFGTPDRYLTTISSMLSIISLIVTVVLWKFPYAIPQLIIIRDLIVVFAIIFILIIIFLKFIKKDKELIARKIELNNANSLILEQYSMCHQTIHIFRNALFEHYIEHIPDEIYVSLKEKMLFEKICEDITLDLKTNFKKYYMSRNININDGDLAVTLKLTLSSQNILDHFGQNLDPSQKESIMAKPFWVITAYRDHTTCKIHQEKREVGTRVYDITQNTAFIKIFTNKADYYYCDDLDSLKVSYLNQNTNRSKQYNSTIVAPIRFKKNSTFKYFGFIAVDSLNPNKYNLFENTESVQIMGAAADLLANFFLSIALLNSQQVAESS